ncbi:MAG: tRNA (N(6)-L-threonylcarbamoyladenosine(37)-C(2))-methylthiotransferase [Methanoculleaceae archaeon]
MDATLLDDLRGRDVHIASYGCTYNHADAEELREICRRQGCRIVPEEGADLVIIATCTVIQKTENRVLAHLSRVSDREVMVTGCLPLAQPYLMDRYPNVRVIHPEIINSHYGRPGVLLRRGIGVVKAARGCPGRCTYCITRLARGPLRSMPPDRILEGVEWCASRGAAEIQLTAQDLSAWGRDLGRSLPDLISRLTDLSGDFRVRAGMMNPATLIPLVDEVVELWDDPLFRFVHIPVQSGSDSVLEAMKRGYTRDEFVYIIETFRERFPDIRISTDILVGFPGETEEDFRETVEILRRIRPTKVNITRFSPRPGTKAAEMLQLPGGIVKNRSRRLHRIVSAIAGRHAGDRIGDVVPFLVTESKRPGTVTARTPNYEHLVITGSLPPGTRGYARITGHRRFYLIAERLS